MLDASRLSWLTGLLVFLTGTLLSVGAAEPADPFAAIATAEKEGKLAEALDRLQSSKSLSAAYKEHEIALEALLRTFDSVNSFIEHERYDQAQSSIEKLLPQLDPVRDTYLLYAAQRKLSEIQKLAWQAARADATKALQQANRLFARGDYDEAIVLYNEVAESKSSDISAASRRDARQGKARAEAARTKDAATGFWSKTWQASAAGIQRIAEWTIYLVALILALWGVRRWRKRLRPRDATNLVIEDLTVASTERPAMSQNLVRELLLRIRALGGDDDGTTDVDRIADLDGSPLGNLRVTAEPLTEIETRHPRRGTGPNRAALSFPSPDLFTASRLLPRALSSLLGGIAGKARR